jgi:Leucine-rich repeat (LRR) protein
MLARRKLEQIVLSNPIGALPVDNAKAINNCTELYLGRAGITQIRNFDLFSNLRVLYLNDNKVRNTTRSSAF